MEVYQPEGELEEKRDSVAASKHIFRTTPESNEMNAQRLRATDSRNAHRGHRLLNEQAGSGLRQHRMFRPQAPSPTGGASVNQCTNIMLILAGPSIAPDGHELSVQEVK